ncbi:hypothetical protein RUND412_009849 [Rhizina undulata]
METAPSNNPQGKQKVSPSSSINSSIAATTGPESVLFAAQPVPKIDRYRTPNQDWRRDMRILRDFWDVQVVEGGVLFEDFRGRKLFFQLEEDSPKIVCGAKISGGVFDERGERGRRRKMWPPGMVRKRLSGGDRAYGRDSHRDAERNFLEDREFEKRKRFFVTSEGSPVRGDDKFRFSDTVGLRKRVLESAVLVEIENNEPEGEPKNRGKDICICFDEDDELVALDMCGGGGVICGPWGSTWPSIHSMGFYLGLDTEFRNIPSYYL